MSSYRDELRALQSRKQALEAEVEGLRHKEDQLDDAREELAERDQELDELRAQLRRTERALAAHDPAVPSPAPAEQPPEQTTRAPLTILLLLTAVGVAIYFFLVRDPQADAPTASPLASKPFEYARAPLPPAREPSPLNCGIVSEPAGAQVSGPTFAYLLNGGKLHAVPGAERPYLLGRTPLQLATGDYDISVVLPGYEPATVHIESFDPAAAQCAKRIILKALH